MGYAAHVNMQGSCQPVTATLPWISGPMWAVCEQGTQNPVRMYEDISDNPVLVF